MRMTIAALAATLDVGVLTAWRRVVKHGWPVYVSPERGVEVEYLPPNEAVEGEWKGFPTTKIKPIPHDA